MDYKFEIILDSHAQHLFFRDRNGLCRLADQIPRDDGQMVNIFPSSLDYLRVLYNKIGTAIDDLETKENLKSES